MATITDPVAINFVNESIRPLAEKARALAAMADDMEAAFANIDTQPGNADTIERGGLPTVTWGEVKAVKDLLRGARDVLNTGTNSASTATYTNGNIRIEAMTVRPLDAN